MQVARLVEGASILLKYSPEAEVSSGHDEVFLGGPDPSALTPEDLAKLEKLNFRYDDKFDCWAVFV